MVKISYAYKKKQKNSLFLERERKKHVKICRILLFHSEIGRRELQTL